MNGVAWPSPSSWRWAARSLIVVGGLALALGTGRLGAVSRCRLPSSPCARGLAAVLGLVLATPLFSVGLTKARTIVGLLISGLAWALAAIRGLPPSDAPSAGSAPAATSGPSCGPAP